MIKTQGLTGDIDVQIMEDVNFEKREWKCAAKYQGNSIDLYELIIKSNGSVEENFIESNENSIEGKIQEFFN